MAWALTLLTLLLLLPPSLGALPSVPRPPGSPLEEEPTSGKLRLLPGASDAHFRPGKLPSTYRTKRPWLGDHLFPSASKARVSRALPRSTTECQLQSLLLPVTELGLGYNSDETITFRYCAGSCHSPHTHHGLTLARLSGSSVSTSPASCSLTSGLLRAMWKKTFSDLVTEGKLSPFSRVGGMTTRRTLGKRNLVNKKASAMTATN
ncbi:persephin isoform X2 [Notamacropus eugenii]|uniref:persephin isoform X2 n=1 Tax=Notamacropus eugenii TaxID=9315 RepID=UPI003B672971